MADWDLLLTDANVAGMQAAGEPYGVIEEAAVAVANGAIAWIGPAAGLPARKAAETRSVAGRWLTPALVDCHTHLVFAGNRAAEFEQRRRGATYEEIARAGGGIVSTVTATRRASADALQAASAVRMAALRREGVATVEIKSGYGLDLETELKMLRVARALGGELGMTVRTSFLGAHTLPQEYKGRADEYLAFLTDTVLPAAHAEGLVDAVDAYCERIAFSDAQVTQVFEAARALGLPVKLHADQLSDSGGAMLASGFRALSADHLEYASDAGIEALAEAGCVAVLLPGAFLTLGETQLPPVERLRELGVPIAIASDCNPGTSPVCSLQTTMVLAASLFKLTPEECLAGVTREAARALGLGDRGTLEVGKRADIAVWDVGHPRELSYWLGLNPLHDLIIEGRPTPGRP
ncbi:MAG TPA: imidazolonepropionase [Woeseiaceae bacterium]|nr:imidazolonepropionase [Woeseiaceae bacterium]